MAHGPGDYVTVNSACALSSFWAGGRGTGSHTGGFQLLLKGLIKRKVAILLTVARTYVVTCCSLSAWCRNLSFSFRTCALTGTGRR